MRIPTASLLAAALMLGSTLASAAEADISLGLQARPRLEKSFGGNIGAQPGGDNYRVTQRTRAIVETSIDFAKIRVSLQDVRTWASENGTLSDFSADDIDFHEAYAELGKDWFQLRVGRQELALNEQRLIGAPDFAQQNRAFDAVYASFTGDGDWKIEAVASRLSDDNLPHDLFVLNPSMVFAGRFGAIDIRAPLHLQTNAMVAQKDRGGNSDDWNRFTGGLFISGSHKAINWRAEGYGQFGDHPASGDEQVAFMFGGRFGYTFFDWLAPVLWVDYLSGDANHVDDQVESFDTLYPAAHGFYGLMDRFSNVPKSTDNGGLVDLALKNKGKVGHGTLVTDVHLFLWAQQNDEGQEGPIGVEVDLVYELPIVKRVSATAGLSLFFDTGDFMQKRDADTRAWVAKNKTVHDFFYLTLDVKI